MAAFRFIDGGKAMSRTNPSTLQPWVIYSEHKTSENAELALEDYYASGQVSESERPTIRKVGRYWCITLND